jgi:hypothetical protein
MFIVYKQRKRVFGFFILMACRLPLAHSQMTVSGPITADSISVTGDVTMSNIMISSLTVTKSLQITGSTVGIPENVVQMISSNTIASFQTTTTSYAAIQISSSIVLANASDYVRISLTGMLNVSNSNAGSAYLTIMRDTTDLGNTVDNSGLAIATSNLSTSFDDTVYVPVGITIVDFPGDTSSHTYQAFIRTSTTTVTAEFTTGAVGYLLLEEINP